MHEVTLVKEENGVNMVHGNFYKFTILLIVILIIRYIYHICVAMNGKEPLLFVGNNQVSAEMIVMLFLIQLFQTLHIFLK